MKGALLQRIFALLIGDSILSDNVIEYVDPPSLTDLPDNGLVTKDMLVSQFAPAIPIETDITQGVTLATIAVPYTDGWVNPTVLFRDATGNNYTGYTNYQDTGSAIVLTSPTEDGVTSSDTYIMIIKA